MTTIDRIAVLNRLLNRERFSLANYLQSARPWVRPTDKPLQDAVELIAREQLDGSRRLAALITRRRASVDPGQGFPTRYTAYNDLDLRFLLGRLIEDQEQIVREVRADLTELRGDAEVEALAAGVLGNEQTIWKRCSASATRGRSRNPDWSARPEWLRRQFAYPTGAGSAARSRRSSVGSTGLVRCWSKTASRARR
jgi:hypothetical protein